MLLKTEDVRDGCRFPPLLGFRRQMEEKRNSLCQSLMELESQAMRMEELRADAAWFLAPFGTRSKTRILEKETKSSMIGLTFSVV